MKKSQQRAASENNGDPAQGKTEGLKLLARGVTDGPGHTHDKSSEDAQLFLARGIVAS